MNDAKGRQLLVMSFFVAIAMVTWQEVRDAKIVPRPRRYVSAAMVYGILGVAAPVLSYSFAGILGVGMVLALFWQHYNNTSTVRDADVDTSTGGISV